VGYMRIRGELIKLGYFVSATSIRNLMRKHGVPPSPRRWRARHKSGLRGNRVWRPSQFKVIG
jgi:hypothetical protein